MFSNHLNQVPVSTKNHLNQDENGSILTSDELLTKLCEEKEEIKFYLSKITKSDETEIESLASIAVQDAIKEQPTYSGEDNANVWLYKIATNVAINHIRKKRNIS